MEYFIELEDKIISTTKFEYADVSMGMVYGKVDFINTPSPYTFFKSFCQKFNIELAADYPDNKLLTTRIIPQLKIYNSKQEHIRGEGYFTGMNNNDFQIEFRVYNFTTFKKEFQYHL